MDPFEDWRLESPGGIKHKLISQSGTFKEEDADWQMVVVIRSEDLEPFMEEVFPNPSFVSSISYPRRFFPAGLPALAAVQAQVQGFTSGKPIDPYSADPSAVAGTYEQFLQITITFSTVPENDNPDPNDPFTFLEISGTSSGEFLSGEVSGDSTQWENNLGSKDSPDEQDGPLEQRVPSSEIEWSCKWKQIDHTWFHHTLLPRLRSLIGKVNEDDMVALFDSPPETILFLSWSMSQQFSWRSGRAGASPVALDLKFLEKNFEGWQEAPEDDSAESSASSASASTTTPSMFGVPVQVTHNHIWRPNRGWFRPLINDDPMFELDDLNSIFTF